MDYYNICKKVCADLSFFELMTLIAYYVFSAEGVDVAIFEAGMGGKWDATNLISSDIAIITTIDYDHTNYLGDEITDIAKEKIGIIKDTTQFVINSKQNYEEVNTLINEKISKKQKLFSYGQDYIISNYKIAVGGTIADYQTLFSDYYNIYLSLFGKYQTKNAINSLVATELFIGQSLQEDLIIECFNNIKIPGRFDRISKNPTIYVDAAHNANSIKNLCKTITTNFVDMPFIGIFGCYIDKNAVDMLAELEKVLTQIVITTTDTKRSYPAEDLYSIAIDIFGIDRVFLSKNLTDAKRIAIAQSVKLGGKFPVNIIATGSINLIGNLL
jgi:dihydrofolate synthase/folylpolyglutamate synthase